jgi:hypothetical protein
MMEFNGHGRKSCIYDALLSIAVDERKEEWGIGWVKAWERGVYI